LCWTTAHSRPIFLAGWPQQRLFSPMPRNLSIPILPLRRHAVPVMVARTTQAPSLAHHTHSHAERKRPASRRPESRRPSPTPPHPIICLPCLPLPPSTVSLAARLARLRLCISSPPPPEATNLTLEASPTVPKSSPPPDPSPLAVQNPTPSHAENAGKLPAPAPSLSLAL
jgi:hypothetical protein